MKYLFYAFHTILSVFSFILHVHYLCSMKQKTFDITLPTSWEELTDKQLHLVYELFARDLSAAEVKAICLMKWNALQVLASLPHHRYLIKRGKEQVLLCAGQIQQATAELDFLDSFAPTPVRISKIGRYNAIAADFEKVPFEKYLFVDNLFQGYLNTQQDELLVQMAQILYDSDNVKPDRAQQIGIFYWMASLKEYFARMFSNFYRQTSSQTSGNLLAGSADTFKLLIDNMNAQIRALTGGDITKEDTILKMDTWRALTELDAKAREVEEIRKASKKT